MNKLFIVFACSLIMNMANAEQLIRETPLGLEKDGEIIRSNPLGNYETKEGTYRKDSLGRWTNGKRTFRKDALGRWTDDKGTIIRKTPLGLEIEHDETEYYRE